MFEALALLVVFAIAVKFASVTLDALWWLTSRLLIPGLLCLLLLMSL